MHRWCDARKIARGAVMSIPQAWALSQKWYGTRLEQDFRRPTLDEAHAIFESVGLTGEFWRLDEP